MGKLFPLDHLAPLLCPATGQINLKYVASLRAMWLQAQVGCACHVLYLQFGFMGTYEKEG